MSRQLDVLIAGRVVEPHDAADEVIAGLWDAAVGSYGDSLLVRRPDNRVAMCYQAGLQAASAVVAAAGYRVRPSGGNHHANTFATVAALDLGALSEHARDLNLHRTQRHRSVYTPERALESVAMQTLGPLDRTVRAFLASGYDWLRGARPSIAPVLEPPLPAR